MKAGWKSAMMKPWRSILNLQYKQGHESFIKAPERYQRELNIEVSPELQGSIDESIEKIQG